MNDKRAYNKKGNPFQRGKTWTIIYYIKNADGTKTQKWKGGYKTKKEAEEDLKVYQAKAALQQITSDTSLILSQYLDNWFSNHKKMLAPNTVNGYAVNINNHIIPAIGNIKLKDIKPCQLETFYTDLIEEKHLSAKTVKYVHNVLKVALKAAVDNKLISDNPCLKAKTPKIPKYQSQLLSVQQLKTLLKAVSGSRYEVEIKLAAMLGLRKGEVLGLKISDLDTEKHTLHIQRQVSIVRDNTIDKDSLYYGVKPLSGHALIQERKIGTDEIIEFEVSGDRIQAVHMLPGYAHNIINLSANTDLITIMWANEQFNPQHPDTFFEVVK